MPMIKLKRAYEPASKDDGLRILVERLWPRGVSKQKAQIDLWLKTLAPSTELRQWYGQNPARSPQFRQRYRAELKDKGDVLALLRYITEEGVVTFIYAATDEERNTGLRQRLALDQAEAEGRALHRPMPRSTPWEVGHRRACGSPAPAG
jgi:uncharacterized protein YeaO (DUF488 family)